ncbi:capsule-associated protein CAP1 [Podochytrium sp. JEL0797]|nr:capsule-associated protein CAP1 [Podochytrium sp. JEL0797]
MAPLPPFGMLLLAFVVVVVFTNLLMLWAMGDVGGDKITQRHRDEYIAYFDRSPPAGYHRWVPFAQENACPTHPKHYAQIYRDLDPWFRTGGISKDQFNSILGMESSERKFTFYINWWDEPLLVLSDNNTSPVYSDIDDVFNRSACFRKSFDSILPDNLIAGTQPLRSQHGFLQRPDTFKIQNIPGPLFSQSKLGCFQDILMPLGYHINIAKSAGSDVDKYSWEDKKNVLFWRGSTTGGSYRTGSSYHQFHRTRLMDWALQFNQRHPTSTFDASVSTPPNQTLSVDVGFSNVVQADDKVKEEVTLKYGLKGKVNFGETKSFKYLLVVDGNTWPSRLQAYLATNSVVLYNGIFTDFFNWRLIPFVHYVPVRLDLSDLEERLEWLVRNDAKAKEIVANAQALMKGINNVGHLHCYTSLLLLEYKNLLE